VSRDPRPGDPHDLLDQLVVAVAGDARRFREAGVHRRIGDDAGQRIQFDHVRHAKAVHTDVDAAPITAAERAVRVERGAPGLATERVGDAGRRALENVERMLARVPNPFRLVAVHGRRAGRERGEIEFDDRETPHVAVVAEDRDREFRPGEIRLDEDRLGVPI